MKIQNINKLFVNLIQDEKSDIRTMVIKHYK
jgi:hypothetical protein